MSKLSVSALGLDDFMMHGKGRGEWIKAREKESCDAGAVQIRAKFGRSDTHDSDSTTFVMEKCCRFALQFFRLPSDPPSQEADVN